MALYFSDFDEEKTAFVNPWDTTKKQADFPSVAVSTFSTDIVEDYVKECNPRKLRKYILLMGIIRFIRWNTKAKRLRCSFQG